MTGFGRGSAATAVWQATVEISAVNRKQAEVVLQAPRELNELDARIRQAVLATVSRGRIQVAVHLERAHTALADFRIDPALAQAFSAAFTALSEAIGHPVVPAAADYLRHLLILGPSVRQSLILWAFVRFVVLSVLQDRAP